MMKKKQYGMRSAVSKAVFLLFLILTLPLYTAVSFAAIPTSVQIPTYQGEEGIPRFRRAINDVLHVQVPVKINVTDETELSTKVFLQSKIGGKVPFTSCTHVKGYDYVCALDDPSDYIAGKFTDAYEITVSDKSCTLPDALCKRKLSPLFVDAIAPAVTFIAPSGPTAGPLLVSQLSVTDVLCQGGSLCKDSCAGIKTVQVVAETGEVLFTKEILDIYPQQKCEYNPTIVELDISALPEGKNTICAFATDHLGNSGEENKKCQEISINKQIPTIDSFALYDQHGNLLNQVGSFMTEDGVQLQFKITTSSALALVKDIRFKVFKSSGVVTKTNECNQQTCTYTSDLIFVSPQDNPLKYELTVTDTTGLIATQTGEISFIVDDKTPEITSIASAYQYQQKNYFAAKENKVTVSFTGEEDGIGLDTMRLSVDGEEYFASVPKQESTTALDEETSEGQDSALYPSAVTPQEEPIPPENICTATECVFSFDFASQNKNSVSITATATDKLSHESKKTETFLIDTNQKPTIHDVIIQDVSSGGVANSYFTAGDAMIITLNVSDNTAMVDDTGNFYVFGNFSELTGKEEFVKADSCTPEVAYNEGVSADAPVAVAPNTESSPQGGSSVPVPSEQIFTGTYFCTFTLQDPLIKTKKQSVTVSFVLSDFTGTKLGYTNPEKKSAFSILWSDTIGEHILKKQEVKVLEKTTLQKQNLWDVSLDKISPQFVDRQVLGGDISLPVVAELNVRTSKDNQFASQTRIEKFSLDQCTDTIGSSDYSSYVDASKTALLQTDFLGKSEGAAHYLQLFLLPGTIDGSKSALSINCTFKTVGTYKDKLVDPESDAVELLIPLANNPLGEIASETREEIEDFKDTFEGLNDFLNVLETIVSIITKLCNILDLINKVHQVLSLTHDVFAGVCDTGYGSFMCGPATAVGEASEALGTVSEKLWGEQIKAAVPILNLKNLCAMMSCRYGLLDWIGEGGKTDSWLDDYNAGVKNVENRLADLGAAMDPKDNIVAATAKLCLPGIIYNGRKMLTISCAYINCLKASAAVPRAVCEKQKANQWCKYGVGQVWSFIPFTRVLAAMGNFLKQFWPPTDGSASDKAEYAANTIFVVAGMACNTFCANPQISGCFGCNVLKLGTMWSQVLCDLGVPMGDKCKGGLFSAEYWTDGWKDASAEECNKALEPLPEIKKPESATPGDEATLGGAASASTQATPAQPPVTPATPSASPPAQPPATQSSPQ